MGAFPPGSAFLGRLASLSLQLSSIVTAVSVTFRLTADINGDETLIPDTSATMDTGITTEADGSAVFKIDVCSGLESGDSVYLWLKTNAGSATLDQAVLIWEE